MAVDITLTASAEDISAQTTYTFSTQSIGAAAVDRLVVVTAHWTVGAGVTSTLTSATVGGLVASVSVQVGSDSAGSQVGVAIIRRLVTSGTTADVSFTLTNTAGRASIDVYRVVGAKTPEFDTGSAIGESSPQSILLDIPAEGGAIATAGANDGSGGGTFTWTGLTEDTDRIVETNSAHSSASDEFATVQSGLTVQATNSVGATGGLSLVGVSFEPNIEEAVGSAVGTSTATATAVAFSFAAAAASGAATVSGVGEAGVPAVASASGTATVSGVGFGGLRPAVGSAAGTSTAAAFASLLHITNTVGIQKPVDYFLAWRGDESGKATPGDASKMSKALLKSIFRE